MIAIHCVHKIKPKCTSQGRIVEIYGQEASGKTTLALNVIREAQKHGGALQTYLTLIPYIRLSHFIGPC